MSNQSIARCPTRSEPYIEDSRLSTRARTHYSLRAAQGSSPSLSGSFRLRSSSPSCGQRLHRRALASRSRIVDCTLCGVYGSPRRKSLTVTSSLCTAVVVLLAADGDEPRHLLAGASALGPIWRWAQLALGCLSCSLGSSALLCRAVICQDTTGPEYLDMRLTFFRDINEQLIANFGDGKCALRSIAASMNVRADWLVGQLAAGTRCLCALLSLSLQRARPACCAFRGIRPECSSHRVAVPRRLGN